MREDSARGRLYFPHEVLREAQVPETPEAALASPNLPRAAGALAAMAAQCGLPGLSMGMSADFEAAIRAGATEVRVGSALFGERPLVASPDALLASPDE